MGNNLEAIQLSSELITSLSTAGAVIASYIAGGRWIKAYFNKDNVSKKDLTDPETGHLPKLEKKIFDKIKEIQEEAKSALKSHKLEHKEELEKILKSIEDRLKEGKALTDKDIGEVRSVLETLIQKNTDWIRDIDKTTDGNSKTISGLQEAIKGIRERFREGS